MTYTSPKPQTLEDALNELRIMEELNIELHLKAMKISDQLKVVARSLNRAQDKQAKADLLKLAEELTARKPVQQLKLF